MELLSDFTEAMCCDESIIFLAQLQRSVDGISTRRIFANDTHPRFLITEIRVSFLRSRLRLLLVCSSVNDELKNLNYTNSIRKMKVKLGKIVKI